MERLDRAAGAMDKVVQDLLLLARSDGGQLRFQLSPVSLRSVLETALACVPFENGPAVHNEVCASSLAVLGDAGHLTRLFSNLLDNAHRHTPPDGRVTVSARQEGERRVVVTISDTGAGIPPEHLPHVTERFYRVDTARARAQGGTGLGLAICQSIAAAHGGEMRIESAEGQGTRVHVLLRAPVTHQDVLNILDVRDVVQDGDGFSEPASDVADRAAGDPVVAAPAQ
jgi:signal transduction histidine kinase